MSPRKAAAQAAATLSLRFHGQVYKRKALESAARAYAEHARVTVAKDGAYWAVEFAPLPLEPGARGADAPPLDVDLLALEFVNYALAENVFVLRGAVA